ncbi:hypothetical protein [Streptomyces sp. NPDC059165]|uniref:hypothetical protein n=1 Tax=Streptomyces sp. NPDC059165 TaxID=3346751 RepID=UPI0036B3E49D
MTPTPHPASAGCYKRGCKQEDCRRKGRRYAKELGYDLARGIRRQHDATQVRAHIHRLMAHEWTHRQIGTAAGLPRSTVSSLAGGQQQTSTRIALAILSVPVGPAPTDPTRVDATGTIRRIRALAGIGHTLVSLAQRIGMTEDRISSLACGSVDVVTPAESRAVASLYKQLSTTPGPSVRSRNDARRKGWHGPLAWDDIDDPAATPDIDEHADKRGRKARVDDATVIQLTKQGLTAEQIAWKLGCHTRTVIRARGRARREDLGAAA